MQDLYRTYPTQETLLDHTDHTAATRQHELDRTDQEYICPAKADLDHEVAIRDLSNVYKYPKTLPKTFLRSLARCHE